MFANYDLSQFPIVRVKFTNQIDDRGFENFLNTWSELYRDKCDFNFIFDTRDMGYIPIKYCLQMALFIYRLKREPHQYLTHSRIIVHNIYIHNLLYLVFNIQKPVSPVEIVDSDGDLLSQL
tara:strand:+ start:307 stop:669 length:363 start_codon:yes stop_codon:yes gene_type:complete